MSLTFAVIGIICLFGIFLLLRNLFSVKICALCGAVSIAWISFLTLYYLEYEVSSTLIGILMGSSIVGTMYLLESKIEKSYQIFKLPFFVTLLTVAYFLIEGFEGWWIILILAVLWGTGLVVHIGKSSRGLKGFARRLIECCKNW